LPAEVTRLAERYLDEFAENEELDSSHASAIQQVAVSRAVDVADRYADGFATDEELEVARRQLERICRDVGMANVACARDPIGFISGHELRTSSDEVAEINAPGIAHIIPPLPSPSIRWRDKYVLILEEMVNPLAFSVPATAWSASNGGMVGKLAQLIYDERSFSDLPILADALMDAGCTEQAILRHCQEPRQHWRGCWCLDLLAGKG
jgi:hypothetical protein